MDERVLRAQLGTLQKVYFWLGLAQRGFAMTCGACVVCAAMLFFLMGHSAAGQSTVLALCLVGLALCVPVVPVAWLARRHFRRVRNALHGRFYAAGLRVDPDWRVVTNEPHPRLVYDGTRVANMNGAAQAVAEAC